MPRFEKGFADKVKTYKVFTEEQQKAYAALSKQQRAYVDFRGRGHNKSESYRMAGYSSKTAGIGSFLLEKNNAVVRELVEVLQKDLRAKQITEKDSDLNKQIDALATQKSAENILATVENADPETLKRIKFYRDIVSGTIKTVKRIKKLNSKGEVLEVRIEETSDIETRMKARKELDRIFGLNELPDLGSLQMGDITINIVDASKREELEDSRNDVVLDVDKEEIIDGEQVVVVGEETETPKSTFFEEVGDKE